MSSDEQLRRIDALRRRYRDILNHFNTNKKHNLDNTPKTECNDFKTCLKSYIEKLEKLENDYLAQMPNSNDAEAAAYAAEIEEILKYNNMGLLSLSAINNRLDTLNNPTTAPNTNTNTYTMNSGGNNNNHSKAKIKPLDLPTYSGKETENFGEFMDTLEEMLSGHELENIEKFIHLKSCLSGDPYHAISALRNNDAAWDDARQTLIELFMDSDEKKFKLLNSFNDLKFSYGESVLSFFSKVDHIIKEIDTIGITAEYFVQYFLWKCIQTNKMLADIYRKTTDEAYPSFQELRTRKNKVMKLYNQQQAEYKEYKNKAQTQNMNKNKFDRNIRTKSNTTTENGMAAHIPNSRYSRDDKPFSAWCSLCKGTNQDNNHAIYKCPQFLTSKEKLARLKSIKGCSQCGYSKHLASQCRYAFKNPCRHCSGNHHGWLCHVNENAKSLIENDCDSVKDSEKGEQEENDSEGDYEESIIEEESYGVEEVQINMCSAAVNRSCLPSNAILPTFKGLINGISCRGLRDMGCQKNFISVGLMKKAGLTPGQKIELTVSGFNSAKTYRTYEVQVPFEFGGQIFDLEMIVLPEVSTKFSADGVSSVAVGFESRGYVLADPDLKYDRNLVGNLDLVLGISATQVFKEKVCMFGENDENYFLETSGGVMPIGHSLTAYSNLKYLPHADKNSEVGDQVKISKYNQCQSKNDALDYLEIKNNKLLKPVANSNNNKQQTKTNPNLTSIKTRSRSRSQNQRQNQQSVKKSMPNNTASKKPFLQNTVVKKSTKNLAKVSFKQKRQMKEKKLEKSAASMATPASIEIRACSSTDSSSKLSQENEIIDNNSALLDSYKLGKIGSNFLRSLTPGYTKQQVFGDWSCFGAASEIDLDKLISETLGYDKYEKTESYSDVDSKIVDYIYNKT